MLQLVGISRTPNKELILAIPLRQLHCGNSIAAHFFEVDLKLENTVSNNAQKHYL